MGKMLINFFKKVVSKTLFSEYVQKVIIIAFVRKIIFKLCKETLKVSGEKTSLEEPSFCAPHSDFPLVAALKDLSAGRVHWQIGNKQGGGWVHYLLDYVYF